MLLARSCVSSVTRLVPAAERAGAWLCAASRSLAVVDDSAGYRALAAPGPSWSAGRWGSPWSIRHLCRWLVWLPSRGLLWGLVSSATAAGRGLRSPVLSRAPRGRAVYGGRWAEPSGRAPAKAPTASHSPPPLLLSPQAATVWLAFDAS